MYALIFFGFLFLPAGFACFLFWRAYQMGIKQRVELTHQWLGQPPAGVETFAVLFAWRDLALAVGLLIYLACLLLWPAYLMAWVGLVAALGFVHQGFTSHALNKLARR